MTRMTRMATDKCAEIWFLSVSIRAIRGYTHFSSLGVCLGALSDSAVAFLSVAAGRAVRLRGL